MGQLVTRPGISNLVVPSLPPSPQLKRDIREDPAAQEAVIDQVSRIMETFELFDQRVRERMFREIRPAIPRHTNGDLLRVLARHTKGLAEALVDIEGLDRGKVKQLAEKAIAGDEPEMQSLCRELLRECIKEERIRPGLISFWLRSAHSLVAEDLDILFKLADLSRRQGGVRPQGGIPEEGPVIDVYRITGVNRVSDEIARRLLESDPKQADDALWKMVPPSPPAANFSRAVELALRHLGFEGAYIEIAPDHHNFGTRWSVYL